MSRPQARRIIGTAICCIAAMCLQARADTLETHNNPVPDGTIKVAPGDTDRTDWEGIPWYEEDFEDELYPVDIHQVRIAHDSKNIYFHLLTKDWDVNELWRVGTYLDTDLDKTTGYTGDFLAVGADHFFEVNVVSEFAADQQADWVWSETASEVAFDQTSLLDKEIAIPRESIGNPEEFDFLLFANNFCCDFQEPDDVYPDEALGLEGHVFTYELGPVPPSVLRGDFDSSGVLDVPDVNLLSAEIRADAPQLSFDLNDDQAVNGTDLTIWVHDLKGTWFGDANLDGEFNSGDLVGLFAAGEYEDAIPMNSTWSTGDFDADGDFGSGDLVAAFADGGYEQGPRPDNNAVPEPSAALMLLVGLAGVALLKSRSEDILNRKAKTFDSLG